MKYRIILVVLIAGLDALVQNASADTSTTGKMNPIYQEVHPAPHIAGGSLQIVVEATQRSAVADGVLLAHGGNVAGYSLHVEQGIPVFEVTRKSEIFRVAWPQTVKGKMRIVADLGDKEMSLSVNGAPKVSAASPGLIRAEPRIGLSVGYDARSNAGSYEVPNPYNGTILSTRIDAGGTPPAVVKVMPRSEIEAGLASHDKALFIKEGWIRDPYIILGPDDYYYLTGTTPNPGEPREQSDPYNTGLGNESIVGWQAQIWRSKDLIDWESLGTPFSLKEGIWFEKRSKRFEEVPEKLWFLWAPEVHWLGDRWALTHTSPSPVRGANLALTEGADLKGPWTHPMGINIGHRHDPSLFKDGDTWYLLYANTQVVPLNADLSSTTAEPVQIDPSGSRTTPAGETLSVIGHEGATMRKIGDKYVHIGTAWSTDTGRKGSYNLYYCTADKITGPYGTRKFAGRFLGHGTPFQDKQGRWWCTAFYNGNIPPVERKGIETRDLGATAQTINQRGTTIVPLDVKVLEDGEIYIRAKDPAYTNPGPDEVQQFAKVSFAAVARENPEKDPASTGSEKQPLSPETEMAIMRVMNLENRIQRLQTVPAKKTNNDLADHFSGTWICFTTMRLNGQLGRGIMEIRLEQEGDELVGEGAQLKHPFDPPSTIRPIGTRSASVSDYVGQFKPARHNMVVIERRRVDGPTWATFTAVMAGDGRTARGTLVNGGGNYGLMFMVRREFLSDFQHLLTEEGRQAEAARRLIGIEKLEAALDTASMDNARIEWWRTDKNRDGKLQYSEFPHPDWKRANRNDDDVVDWAEEVSDRVLRKLAEKGYFLAKHGNDSKKQWASIYAWGVAHPGFEPIFHFVDWDHNGKINAAEYTAFEEQLDAYNDPSFPKTNSKGQTREDLRSKTVPKKKSKGITKAKLKADPHTVKMEAAFSEAKLAKAQEMWAALDKNHDKSWQYDEFPHPDWKRANRDGDDGLSWKEELADQMFRSQSRTYPKAHGSAPQKSWDSLEAWIKDRPDYESLFPFIDWDNDGKITDAEYEVFDVQIKSYTDGSWPKTNEQGETGMQVFKRLAVQAKPNVLFIAVDDLRTELSCYGSQVARSPNIDRLASMGTLFSRAYCQQSVCGPSRVSLLCGQRPDTTGVTSLFTKFRDIQPDIVTLPQFFKNNGYHSYRLGKIFHTGHGNSEDTVSWTTPGLQKQKKTEYVYPKRKGRPTTECADLPDNAYLDGQMTDDAVRAMKNFKKNDTPFFLAVGYKKPHLPFFAPKKYWDLYDRNSIPDSAVPQPPESMPGYALKTFGEMRKYKGIPATGPVTEEQKKELQHGYLACVSYVDAQIGRLIDTLEETGLKENTIVILWSDHGWKLNDYASWCKHSNMEIDTQVPLIISAPGRLKGKKTNALVELVDIYPTLVELCGFQIPAQCEGSSMVPLLDAPNRPWKSAAFSQYPSKELDGMMGYSMRYGRWRYVEWISKENGEIKGRELYDHKDSPLANRNQALNPEMAGTVKEHSLKLNKGQGWKTIKQELDHE